MHNARIEAVQVLQTRSNLGDLRYKVSQGDHLCRYQSTEPKLSDHDLDAVLDNS